MLHYYLSTTSIFNFISSRTWKCSGLGLSGGGACYTPHHHNGPPGSSEQHQVSDSLSHSLLAVMKVETLGADLALWLYMQMIARAIEIPHIKKLFVTKSCYKQIDLCRLWSVTQVGIDLSIRSVLWVQIWMFIANIYMYCLSQLLFGGQFWTGFLVNSGTNCPVWELD